MKLTIHLLLFIVPAAFAGPSTSNYQGRLFDQFGDPLNSGTVNIELELRDPSGHCVLYSESHNGVSMVGKSGYVSIKIGSGTPLSTSPFPYLQALSNKVALADINMDCPAAPFSNIYTPAANDGRRLRTKINGDTLSPDQTINSSPYSLYANDSKLLDGKSYDDIKSYSDGNLGGLPVPDLSVISAGHALRWSGSTWELYTPSQDWSDLQNIPAAINDGDNDTLASLSCSANQIAKYSSGSWACVNNNALNSADGSVTNAVYVDNSGNIGIGTSSPNASAALDITTTTKGFLPPRVTEAQRDAIGSPVAGLVAYNTDSNTLQIYNGSAWGDIDSAGGGGGGSGAACTNSTDDLGDASSGRTVADCDSQGGNTFNTADGCVCKLGGSSCPAGWSQLNNYSTTLPKSCSGSGCLATSCGTANHAFGGVSTETCGYRTGGATGGAPYYICSGSYTNLTCTATVLEVGCY